MSEPLAPGALEEVAVRVAGRVAGLPAAPAAALVRSLLLAATPHAVVSSAAHGPPAGAARLHWLVGPLACRGGPPVVVSLAAAVDGEVRAGAVLDVERHELFSAALGGGARRNGGPVQVPEGARTAAVPRSTALGLCWVACGRLEEYGERGAAAWDHLAGVLVAEESGATCELPTPENDDRLTCSRPGQQRTSDPAPSTTPRA